MILVKTVAMAHRAFQQAPSRRRSAGSRRVAACSATARHHDRPGGSPHGRGGRTPVRASCVLDIVIPVYNEERDLPGSVRRLHQLSGRRGALPVANHDRRQRQHRQHAGGGAGARRGAARRRRHPPRREGPRRRAVHRVDGLGGRRGRLHGRRPVDRPVGVDAAGGAADLRPLRRRDRFPVGGVVAGGARAETRIRLAQLQLDPARRARCALLRCAVRLQGDARRRGAPAAAAWSPTPAGSSTPSCW